MATACSPDCQIGDRHYRIMMPNGHEGVNPVGAIVFAHGYRGLARGAMRNMNMRRVVSDMGLAFIAVKSAGPGWDIPGVSSNMQSIGAAEMVTWQVACNRPKLCAGFAPLSGTFWQGPPASCAAPASILRIHGAEDLTVPLAGRAVGGTRQGDV